MAPSRSLVGLLCLTIGLTVAHQVAACIFADKIDPQQMAGMQHFYRSVMRCLSPRHSQGLMAFTGLQERQHLSIYLSLICFYVRALAEPADLHVV